MTPEARHVRKRGLDWTGLDSFGQDYGMDSGKDFCLDSGLDFGLDFGLDLL
jgi:hypothetical protein